MLWIDFLKLFNIYIKIEFMKKKLIITEAQYKRLKSNLSEAWGSNYGNGDGDEEVFISVYNNIVGKNGNQIYSLDKEEIITHIIDYARKTDSKSTTIAKVLLHILSNKQQKHF